MGRSSNKNARKSGYIFEYRFTLLGGTKSGKTSVLNRFISDTFTHRYRPTIEDHVTHTIDHKGNICVCLMVDTCGSDDFPAMKRLAITKGNAFLLIYAIDSRRSFVEAKRTAEEIISLKDASEDVKIMLIANKSDLEAQREVQTQDGLDLVEELNTGNVSSMYFEVSACLGDGVSKIFTELLQMFVPQESSDIASSANGRTPEKSAFSRMSFRRRSKKKQAMMNVRGSNNKNNNNKVNNTSAVSPKPTNNNDSVYYSDTEVEPRNSSRRLLPPDTKGQLVRSSSATSHLGIDSGDSGVDSSPNHSPVFERKDGCIPPQVRRESAAKDMIRKTFGSMQRLLVNNKPLVAKGEARPVSHQHNLVSNNNNKNTIGAGVPSPELVRSCTGDSVRRLSAVKKQYTL